MNGEEILRRAVDERLRELASVPAALKSEAAGRIVSFCQGAADALIKAGLLPVAHPRELDRLYAEIENLGLGQRVSATLEASATVVSGPAQQENSADED